MADRTRNGTARRKHRQQCVDGLVPWCYGRLVTAQRVAEQADDAEWVPVLAHRPVEEIPATIDRFVAVGVTPPMVAKTLDDLGDQVVDTFPPYPLDPADTRWAEDLGGLKGVALLATEIEVYSSYAQRRAARIRAEAFELLIYSSDQSLAELGKDLGMSKQVISRASKRPGILSDFMTKLSWRTPR